MNNNWFVIFSRQTCSHNSDYCNTYETTFCCVSAQKLIILSCLLHRAWEPWEDTTPGKSKSWVWVSPRSHPFQQQEAVWFLKHWIIESLQFSFSPEHKPSSFVVTFTVSEPRTKSRDLIKEESWPLLYFSERLIWETRLCERSYCFPFSHNGVKECECFFAEQKKAWLHLSSKWAHSGWNKSFNLCRLVRLSQTPDGIIYYILYLSVQNNHTETLQRNSHQFSHKQTVERQEDVLCKFVPWCILCVITWFVCGL